jgi:hypothetical protein
MAQLDESGPMALLDHDYMAVTHRAGQHDTARERKARRALKVLALTAADLEETATPVQKCLFVRVRIIIY